MNIIGCYPAFKILQFQVKQEIVSSIRKSVPKNQLHAIDATGRENKLDWHENGQEFSLNGKMYDIVYTEKSNGRIVYYCIDDANETKLFAQLDKMVNDSIDQNTGKHSDTAKKLLKAFSTLTYIPIEKNALVALPQQIQQLSTLYINNYTFSNCGKFSPPPQFIS